MRRAWPRLSLLFPIFATKCARQPSTIFSWRSHRRTTDESILARFRLAEPGGAWPPSAGAPAQLVHRHAAAGLRAVDHVAGLWRRLGPADWLAVLAGCSSGLPALPGGRHPRLHGLHVVLLSIALRRL